ncbi:hypothetical protein CBR_g29697 [Chara braunii]|uniref:CHCH domain-containing protein n=1 Tax=Chara braunii TaxID=69332 RepID=A0A388LB56_CHABU|nr:hypothetical protein CBR_g29697 [Chara braunii]|eukprot:GBG79550.1 hypothetical protein CBR_g29697 [Chara braunii]
MVESNLGEASIVREVTMDASAAPNPPMANKLDMRESSLQRLEGDVDQLGKELVNVRVEMTRKDEDIRKLIDVVKHLAQVAGKLRQSEADRLKQEGLLANLGDELETLEAKALKAEEKMLARKWKFKALSWAMEELKEESVAMKEEVGKLREEAERAALEGMLKDKQIETMQQRMDRLELALQRATRGKYEAEKECKTLRKVVLEVERIRGDLGAAWQHGEILVCHINKLTASAKLKTTELDSVKQKLKDTQDMAQLMAEEVEEKGIRVLKLEEDVKVHTERGKMMAQLLDRLAGFCDEVHKQLRGDRRERGGSIGSGGSAVAGETETSPLESPLWASIRSNGKLHAGELRAVDVEKVETTLKQRADLLQEVILEKNAAIKRLETELNEAKGRHQCSQEELQQLKARIGILGEVLEQQEQQREELTVECERLKDGVRCMARELGEAKEERELLRSQVSDLELKLQRVGTEEGELSRGMEEKLEESGKQPESAVTTDTAEGGGSVSTEGTHAQAQEQVERLLEVSAALTKDLAASQAVVESQAAVITKLEDELQKKTHNMRIMDAAMKEERKRRDIVATKMMDRRAMSMDMTHSPDDIREAGDDADTMSTIPDFRYGMRAASICRRRETERKIKQLELQLKDEREAQKRQVLSLTDELGRTKAELAASQRQVEILLAKCEQTGVPLTVDPGDCHGALVWDDANHQRSEGNNTVFTEVIVEPSAHNATGKELAEEEKLFLAQLKNLKELQEHYNGLISRAQGGKGDDQAVVNGDYVTHAFGTDVTALRAQIAELETKLDKEGGMLNAGAGYNNEGGMGYTRDIKAHSEDSCDAVLQSEEGRKEAEAEIKPREKEKEEGSGCPKRRIQGLKAHYSGNKQTNSDGMAENLREDMKRYMECLREKKFVTDECKQFSKAYLACRMQRNLMAKQDLASLGFAEEASRESQSGNVNSSEESSEKLSSIEQSRRRAQSGFVAGIRRKQRESIPKTEGS